MPKFLLLLCLGLFLPSAASAGDCACEVCLGGDRSAHRAREIATLEATLYHRVGHPPRAGAIFDEIEYTRARIELLEASLREYDTIRRFRTGNALTVTNGEARLELLRERQHLRHLQGLQAESGRYAGRRWGSSRVVIARAPSRPGVSAAAGR